MTEYICVHCGYILPVNSIPRWGCPKCGAHVRDDEGLSIAGAYRKERYEREHEGDDDEREE